MAAQNREEHCVRERRLSYIVWSVVILAALMVLVLVAYLCGWPRWCTDQIAAWSGIGAALGALAMALTALLILEQVTLQAKMMVQIKQQVELQTKTVELQDRQLKYYYLPGVCLQVHYNVQHHGSGVPIAFMTVNQGPVHKINAWIEADGDRPGWQEHMRPKGDGRTQDMRIAMYWDAGVIYSGQEWFGRFGPLQQTDSPQTIVVSWQQTVTAESWEQRWQLWSGDGGWFVSPDGPARPVSS